jgi:PAS domain S-box-containing protein
MDSSEEARPDDRAARLQQLTAALSAALAPADVGAAIIARAMPALGANAANVYLLTDDGRELVSIAALGYDPETLAGSNRLPVDSRTMMAEVARGGEPILIPTWRERLARYPHHRDVHAVAGDRAVAGLPLMVEGRTIGALSLAFPTDRAFSTDDCLFMATVTDLCAQALERARLYDVVRRSEARFRQLAEAMPQIAWVIDAAGGNLAYMNTRWFAYTGLPPGATSLEDAQEPIHPDDRPGVIERWTRAATAGEPFESELRLRGADGTYRWFLTRTVPVRDDAGTIVTWLGTSTDIDATKRVEASQRLLADLGRALAGSLDAEATLREVVRLVVPALADYCFVDLVQPNEAIRRVAWAHVDPREQQVFDAALAQYVPRRLHEDHPIALTLQSGEPRFVPEITEAWLERIAFSREHLEFMRGRRLQSQMTVPLRARGRTLGAMTFCFTSASGRTFTAADLALAGDLADRTALAIDNARLYAEARDAEARVRRLLDAGVVGVMVADAERIVEANDHFLEMVGYSRAELEGGRLRWAQMTPPEFAELDAHGLAELAERGVCTPFEKEYIRRDGSRIPILIGTATLQEDPPLWIGFILDLSEQKRGEEEWRAFVDATAHDLRNPLTTILGQSQLLERRLARDERLDRDDARTRLTSIAAAALRAAGLIDDLMDTARLRAGQPLELRPEPVDLVAKIASCVAQARRAAPSYAVRFEPGAAELQVAADTPRIERVIRNMIDNAIKYSPDGGEIVVGARRDADEAGEWAVITIEDRGIGIPPADLPYVFDRFRRGGNVIGAIAGSGIGLTGARQIVAEHGGAIYVESVEGAGSTFTLRLPLVRSDQ